MEVRTNYGADIILPSSLTGDDTRNWLRFIEKNDALRVAFLSPTFAIAAQTCAMDVRVCRIFRDNRVVAFFPFQFRSNVHAAFGIAERVGGELSDYFGVIAESGFCIDSPHLLKLCGLNAVFFSHLEESQSQFGLSGDNPEIGHRIDFPQGGKAWWEEKRATDKKFTSDTERRERKLAQQFGALRFTFAQTRWEPELDKLLHSKREQYARTKVPDPLRDTRARMLLHHLAASSDRMCQGVLSTLYAGDTWVASHFGLICGGTLHYWFPAYNQQMMAFSPGRLLLKAIIEFSDENALVRIDRGAGDTASKRDFATSQHHFGRGLWKRPNPVSIGYQLGLSARWRLRGSILRSPFARQD